MLTGFTRNPDLRSEVDNSSPSVVGAVTVILVESVMHEIYAWHYD